MTTSVVKNVVCSDCMKHVLLLQFSGAFISRRSVSTSTPFSSMLLIPASIKTHPVRNYRWYRPPKRRQYEIRPDEPPFFGRQTRFQKDLEELRTMSEEKAQSLIEGLDYPLLPGPTRQKLISCTVDIADPYQVPKNETKLVSRTIRSPTKSLFKPVDLFAMRQIRKSMGDFEKNAFLETASDVYQNLFSEITRVPIKLERMMQFCTERCYPVLMEGLAGCQVTWRYVETVEPSRIVRARVVPFLQDDHEFAQITVRMHSKQVLAIYDRFGRLIKGDPDAVRSVLEYVVFERHMNPLDWGSEWRVHGKISASSVGNQDDDVRAEIAVMDFRTRKVPESFVPQFSDVEPAESKSPSDPETWNEKWKDVGFYKLSEEEEEQLRKEKLRKRHMFDMHPTARV